MGVIKGKGGDLFFNDERIISLFKRRHKWIAVSGSGTYYPDVEEAVDRIPMSFTVQKERFAIPEDD